MIPKTVGHVSFMMRKFLFSILSIGPVPTHIAFIMDGNRRYAKKHALYQDGTKPDIGHRVGFNSLITTIQYCFEMGVKHATVYAFSIDNFRRGPQHVMTLMDLMKEKIDELMTEECMLKTFEVRIIFWGNLELLIEPVCIAARKIMDITIHNKGPVLSVCLAYTSTNEITHAIEGSIREKREEVQIYVNDLERNMYTAGCVEPDILIRTSGETRLSNFFLWQSDFTHLQNPNALWPELSLRHLVWAVLEYQKIIWYLKKRKGKTKKNN
ncbi:dehydrodolichyl diphosphate synthase 6-like protein [Carex littledalei]|uniref:Alkyl transferase n=1 Tax=Carex littledalei TaxID=544730 RepID=A0A833RT00_9POAL|nr:dehydrodolichyl diphosphate synthase 6-like protein [Carex littledalei]